MIENQNLLRSHEKLFSVNFTSSPPYLTCYFSKKMSLCSNFFFFFLFLSLNDVVTQHKQKFYLVWNFEFVHVLQLLVLTFLLSPGGKRKGGAGPKIFRKNWRGNLPRRKLWLGIFKVAFMNSFQLFLILSFSLCVYKDL